MEPVIETLINGRVKYIIYKKEDYDNGTVMMNPMRTIFSKGIINNKATILRIMKVIPNKGVSLKDVLSEFVKKCDSKRSIVISDAGTSYDDDEYKGTVKDAMAQINKEANALMSVGFVNIGWTVYADIINIHAFIYKNKTGNKFIQDNTGDDKLIKRIMET